MRKGEAKEERETSYYNKEEKYYTNKQHKTPFFLAEDGS
jgi:hypothetical protein